MNKYNRLDLTSYQCRTSLLLPITCSNTLLASSAISSLILSVVFSEKETQIVFNISGVVLRGRTSVS